MPFPLDPTSLRHPRSGPWPALCLLAGLPVAELAGLSVRLDTADLAGDSGWIQLVGLAPALLRIVLAATAAFLLIAHARLAALAGGLWHANPAHTRTRWLALHLLAFAAFYAAGTALFHAAPPNGPPVDGTLLAGWGLLGTAMGGLWLRAVAPPRAWFGLLARERGALAGAVLAGAAAFGLGEIAHEFWRPLAAGTFWLSRQVLALAYPEVRYDPGRYVLGTPDFQVEISPQCSGYEGIGLILAFLALYLWLFRAQLRFPLAWCLFPVGALAIWLVNALRIAALIAIGTSYSPEIALGGFHSQAGWMAFVGVALGLVALASHSGWLARPAGRAEGHGAPANPAAALLVPLLAMLAALMAGSALSHGFDWLYPLRPVAIAAALWRFRAAYRTWDWHWDGVSVLIGAAVGAAWVWLEPVGGGGALSDTLAALPPEQRAGWLGFRVVGSVLCVPLAEELAFRGYLLRRLAGPRFEEVPPTRFAWTAFVLSSLAFGLLHGRWLAGTLAGMAFAAAQYRRGRLADAVVAHITANALVAWAVLVWGQWSLWA